MLLRGAETKTAKWCTRLSNWNVSGLDRIPQSFSFSLFFFFFPVRSFTDPENVLHSEPFDFANVRDTNEFGEVGMGKLAAKLCRIFPRKNTSFSVATFPNKGFRYLCLCTENAAARGEKKVGLKKSADLFPTIRVVRSANKRMSR